MVDSIIILFDTTATSFLTNGLGSLSDAISCRVSEEANGAFELELKYPINGIHYSDISLMKIIYTSPNPYANRQPFRIYNISKPINGIVTVNAQHLSYDLSGFPVSPFSADKIQNALVNMKNASVTPCPFVFSTNKETIASMVVTKPTSIRSLLGGSKGSILDIYGGDYEFDGYNVKLYNTRGVNRGVSIRYGKNLTDLKQEENCNSVYTGVYPFWYSESEGLAQLPEKTLNAIGTYDFVKIMPLDLSSYWQTAPSYADIRTMANNFMINNNIGIPTVSITVSFALLAQSEEYKDIATLEEVNLWDMIDIEFPELGVSATAQCVKTTYNVITNKYESVELGDVKSNLATTIASGGKVINNKIDNLDAFFSKQIDNIKIDVAVIESAIIDKVDIGYANINYAHITDGVLDAAQIGKASIIDSMIVGLTASKITAGTIDAAEIDVINLHAVNITVGTINGNQISQGTIDTGNIAVGAITAEQLAMGTITEDKIALGAISANHLNLTNHILY